MIWQTVCYNTVISLRMFLGFSEMGHIVRDYHSHYRRQRLYKTCKTNKTNTYNWSAEFWSSSHECSLIKNASEKWWIWKTGDRSDINTALSTLECHALRSLLQQPSQLSLGGEDLILITVEFLSLRVWG